MHFERKEAKVQLFLTCSVTFMSNTVGRILCFYSVDRLFSFRLSFSDIVALYGVWGEGTAWEGVGVCVLHVPFCTVTSVFALFRIVPSPPVNFWNVLPKCHVPPLFSPSVEQKPWASFPENVLS